MKFRLKPAPGLTEAQEQMHVARWLHFKGYLFTHPPNGGKRDLVTAANLRRMGTKAGVPDLLIFTPPPKHRDFHGVAIEMKRVSGGRLSTEQKFWLDALAALGWVTMCCRGSRDAIAQLQDLGY